jgi:Cu+-exporting ATPase
VTTTIDLDIGGMTCASCVARIEKKLGKLPGVVAQVNLATERAQVSLPSEVSVEDVIRTVEGAGYTAQVHVAQTEAPDEVAQLRRRLIVCALLTAPVAALSMVPAWQFPAWQWVCLALATPVASWGAWRFHRSMALNLVHRSTTMDTLVSLGVIASYLWSLYALTFGGAGALGMTMAVEWVPRHSADSSIYLEVASVLTTLILVGRFLEARATQRSSAAIRTLLDLGAKQASLWRDGRETLVPIAQLRVGDQFVVHTGERIATDGVVVEGHSAVDESMLTGESVPRDVGVDDPVVGATVNAQGRLLVRATRVGADTQLAQMGRLIEQAQMGKPRIQRLVDQVAAVFVPVVIGLSLATLAGWLLAARPAAEAFAAAVAVLVIACPCALGLATPAALMVGTGRGAQLGILIKGPQILEASRRIDTVVVDKTGTLTTGKLVVADVVADQSVSPEEVAGLAAAVEAGSQHPLALAVLARFGPPAWPVSDFAAQGGLGVTGVVARPAGAVPVSAGRLSWVAESATITAELRQAAAAAEQRGHTVIAVAWDGQVQGLIAAADTVKATSAQAVAALQRLGLTVQVITGDNPAVARTIADQVGITQVVAQAMPEDKVSAVARLQAEGHAVAMVGDGINDAAALSQANLGIAMGAGADVAIEASDITLVRDDLLAAVDAIRLARATLARIKGNLFWAFAYNVAAIPRAVAGMLNPMIAGAAMAASSVFVVQNSLWLRRFSPTKPAGAPPGAAPAGQRAAGG